MKEERGKRKEERGKRKEERMARDNDERKDFRFSYKCSMFNAQ
jgi:hypothetical protein